MPDASFNSTKAIWFIIKKLSILLIVGLIAYYVYSTALNITNVYVVASDGMHELAAQSLMQDASTPLSNYFSQEIIDNKQFLISEKYSNCDIWDFKYKLKVEPFICLPASNSITITATETVSKIDGEAASIDGVSQEVPAWDNAKYRITLDKNSKGQWIIKKLDVIEDLPDATQSQTIKAIASPTPIN